MFGSNNKCPECGHANKSKANFCGNCRADLKDQRDPDIKGNAWQARDDEFAASITIDDLEGFFAKSPLVIKPGQQALVFQENRCQGSVGPGEYQLESFLSVLNRLGQHKDIWAIICREDELSVSFGLGRLPTQEFLDVEVELSLGMRVSDPDRFARLLSGKAAFTIADLRKQLQPQLRQTLAEHFRGRGIRELQADTNLRADLDMLLSKALEPFLDDMGIGLGIIQTMAVGHTRLDENNQIRAESWLAVDKQRAELESREQLAELYSEEEWGKIERLELDQQIQSKIRDLEFNEKEQQFTDRLRRIALLEKVKRTDTKKAEIELQAAEELAQLAHEAKKHGLLRENEELSWGQTQELAAIKLDTEIAIAKLEQERILTEERMGLECSKEMAEIEHDIEVAKKIDDEAARRKTAELERKLSEVKSHRDDELKEKQHELELHELDQIKSERYRESECINFLKKEKAKLEVAVDGLEVQQLIDDLDHERKKKEDELKLAKLRALAEMDSNIDKQELAKEQALREEGRKDREQDARSEREKMEVLGKLGADALIHLSSAEQGSIIADLQRSKAMQGMDSEQILAMAAENSPAVAEALKERYRNANASAISENERAMYEKMVQQQEAVTDRMQRMSQENQTHNAALMNKMLDTVVGMQSNTPQPQSVIVTPGGVVSQPTAPSAVETAPSKEKILICPECRAENELHARFCDNCGGKLG